MSDNSFNVSVDEFDAILAENTQASGGRASVYCKAQFSLGLTWFVSGFNSSSDDVFYPYVPSGATKEEREQNKKTAVEKANAVALAKGIPVVNPVTGKKISTTFAIRVISFKDHAFKEMGEGNVVPITTWTNDQAHCYPDWKGNVKGEPYMIVMQSLKTAFAGKFVPFGTPVYVKIEFVPDPSATGSDKKYIETVTEVYESFYDMAKKAGIVLLVESSVPGYTDEIRNQGYDITTWRGMISQFKTMSASGKTAEQIAGDFDLPVESVAATLA